jgi:hypothetical protein
VADETDPKDVETPAVEKGETPSTEPDVPEQEDDRDFHDGDDDAMMYVGEVALVIEVLDGKITYSGPAELGPSEAARYLDFAVEALGKLRTQIQ